jgi:hypothetical protein
MMVPQGGAEAEGIGPCPATSRGFGFCEKETPRTRALVGATRRS